MPASQEHQRSPFRVGRGGDLSKLRPALDAAGYTQTSLAKKVLSNESGRPLDVPALLRRTAEPSPYNTLLRLFVLARPVAEEAARAALEPAELEPLTAVGLLRRDKEGVRAEAALIPFEDLLLARDFWPDFTAEPARRDHVMGVGPSSLAVANLTVRRPIELALDLGTGCGVFALLAARHADRVIATDTNPRALNFAALNARLNGVSSVELRRGDLYEPVTARHFDLIVCNPPYAISPRSEYQYRDSGLPGDAICERVIRGAPPRLREGGFCSVVFNWHHQSEDDWAERPTQWLEGTGCDAWVLRSDMTDPIGYAATWLRHAGQRDPSRYERQLAEWLAYHEQLGIRQISSGAVVLRRRSAPSNWIRAEDAPPGRPLGSCSDQIQRVFAAQDLIEQLTDEQSLLERSFVLAPDHELEHLLHAKGGDWVVKAARLRQTSGFPFTGNVDRLVGMVLAGCDGHHSLRELVNGLAAALKLDAGRVGPACTGVVRTLLGAGFLTLADDPPAAAARTQDGR